MHNPADYRKYAEECERLAQKYPAHKETLLEMAKAWRACMDGAERKTQKITDGKDQKITDGKDHVSP